MRISLQRIAICVIITLIAISTTTAQTRSGYQFTPTSFDPKKHILLVAEMPGKKGGKHEGATKKLDKALKERYPYKYEIVPIEDIIENPAKYADTTIYKYALISSVSSYERSTQTTITTRDFSGTHSHTLSPSANVTSIDYYFYDRVTGERFPNSGWHSSFIGMTMKKVTGIIKKEKGL